MMCSRKEIFVFSVISGLEFVVGCHIWCVYSLKTNSFKQISLLPLVWGLILPLQKCRVSSNSPSPLLSSWNLSYNSSSISHWTAYCILWHGLVFFSIPLPLLPWATLSSRSLLLLLLGSSLSLKMVTPGHPSILSNHFVGSSSLTFWASWHPQLTNHWWSVHVTFYISFQSTHVRFSILPISKLLVGTAH